MSFFSEAAFFYASILSIALSQLLGRWSFFGIFKGKGAAPIGFIKVASWFFVLSLRSFIEQAPIDTSEGESDIEESSQREDNLATLNDPEDSGPELDLDQFFSTNQKMLDLVKEQHARGNVKFVQRVAKANASNQVLVDEVNQLLACRKMPYTWLFITPVFCFALAFALFALSLSFCLSRTCLTIDTFIRGIVLF